MEKKEMSLPTVLYPEIVQPSEKGEKKKRNTTKRIAIVSIATVVSLALILGSVLLAIHLVSERDESSYVKEKTITTKDENGKETKEKMYVNTKTKEEAFETSKISVVHDFEKSLTVIKTQDNENKYVCYLTTLNSTGMMNPAEMEKALSSTCRVPEISFHQPLPTSNKLPDNDVKESKDDKGNERDEKFQQTAVKVNSRGFLSPKAKAMCEGYTIYWLIPTGEKKEADSRQKRAVCFRTYRYCYWCYYYGWRVCCRNVTIFYIC